MPQPRVEFFWQIPPPGPTRWQMPGVGWWWACLELTEPLCVHVCLCRREHNFLEHITSSYLTKVARHLLGDGVSSIEDRQSATLERVALTSSLPAGAATSCRSAAFITRTWTRLSTSGLSGVEKVSRVHCTGKSLDRLSTTIWAGMGQVNWANDLHRSLTSG